MNSRPGVIRWIYFVRATSGQIKIGVAGDPVHRLKALQIGSPVGLELLVVVAESEELSEGAMHAHFAALRLHGEWFRGEEPLLAFIQAALRGDPLPAIEAGRRRGGGGFAAMSAEQRRAIATKGGQAAQRLGTAHRYTSEEAARAGRLSAVARGF